MRVGASVVVPVRNGAETLGDCLRALGAQDLPRGDYEVIVVDDGSRDGTASVVSRTGAHYIRQEPSGAPTARNRGLRAAEGDWIAFTDSDCIPGRTWLRLLLRAVAEDSPGERVLGAAGRTLGYPSGSPASRFVDLTGGLDAGRYLSHETFPFAPSANLMYSREALEAVGGFDPRYRAYDACDIHTRLLRAWNGRFRYVPRAVVIHRHRVEWRRYWRQQVLYGRGYAQFVFRYRKEIPWSLGTEFAAWGRVARSALQAVRPGRDDPALIRRGQFMKELAQRIGFLVTYWNPSERRRW